TLSTYGILSAYTEKELTEWIQFLVSDGVLATEEGKYPTLKLNRQSVDVLKGKRKVWMYTTPIPTIWEVDYDNQLFDIWRNRRKVMADRNKVKMNLCLLDM